MLFNSFVRSKLFVLVEIALLGIVVVGFLNVREKKKNIDDEIVSLSYDIESAQVELQALDKRIEETSNDSYVELEAKRKLHYRRPDETVFIFYEPKEKTGDVQRKSFNGFSSDDSGGNWRMWLNYFFPKELDSI
jgi:cell division protein FtsB